MSQTVHVARDNLGSAQLADTPLPELEPNAVRLKIDSFSVTANNVTYAVAGEQMGYWNFFPAPSGKGVVPMWGHAVVTASNHPDIVAGERVYGYLPMGTHLDVEPGKVSDGSFVDLAGHRQPMSPIYNTYSRLSADPEHDAAREAERMIFGPLFKTGYLIETMFRSEGWSGAGAMVMTSASSKTSMALASVAKEKSPAIKRIGLTSAGNVAFTQGTGLYDEVLAYDAVAKLENAPTVSVDFAGNSSILRSIHEHLRENLAYSCLVGATHVGGRDGSAGSLPGPQPILFFAPTYAVAAIKEQGPKAFGEAVAASWKTFLEQIAGTVDVEIREGLDAARSTYLEILSGNVDPAKGIVIRP
ncbi:DUF2855 family protein [Altererythrobacter aquiaggeris]|uniref:DUF2855 family protein n=1 Tax=Aestuarierythrobacter aquiaggeris TaxID=1898396 RepID=UPI003018818B